MATSTVEDYLKQILLEQQDTTAAPIPMGKVARALSVAPGTATAMMKTMSEAGLVVYQPRIGVRLTAEGEKLAIHVVRRHRLIELFLVKILGLDWSEVHEEAETLEHVISDRVLEKIDTLLDHPTSDPHGDPIPTSQGKLISPKLKCLEDCAIDQPLRIVRITDQAPEFLHFIDNHGLAPGTELRVKHRDKVADSITLRFPEGKTLALGSAAGKKILVK